MAKRKIIYSVSISESRQVYVLRCMCVCVCMCPWIYIFMSGYKWLFKYTIKYIHIQYIIHEHMYLYTPINQSLQIEISQSFFSFTVFIPLYTILSYSLQIFKFLNSIIEFSYGYLSWNQLTLQPKMEKLYTISKKKKKKKTGNWLWLRSWTPYCLIQT